MRLYDLKQKEIINIKTCRSLGCISDLDIDCKTGCILALIVPGPGRLCWFLGRDFEFFIPWKCIVQIGADIILVDIDEENCRKKCGS
ncbi:MAG: YlmC/YmxH family sporulation protein [Candidatus Choladocola sp.]|nr:YlmC/YmxH family sporulation protein [Candidatus Choladocola sp.]